MTASNHTSHYNLSQFAETDRPTWLGDYNADMSKIDTAIAKLEEIPSLKLASWDMARAALMF